MAIFNRIKWNVIQNNQLHSVVSFPASFDENAVKRALVSHYGYTGDFKVERTHP